MAIEDARCSLFSRLRSLARAWRNRPHLVATCADAAPQVAEAARVRIGPGDLLHLAVFDVPQLTQELRVSDTGRCHADAGRLASPQGLTAAEAQTLIEDRLQSQANLSFTRMFRSSSVSTGRRVYRCWAKCESRACTGRLARAICWTSSPRQAGTTPFAAQQATVKRRASEEKLTASLSNDPAEVAGAGSGIAARRYRNRPQGRHRVRGRLCRAVLARLPHAEQRQDLAARSRRLG